MSARRSSLGSQRSTSSQDDHFVPGHGPSRSSSELNLKEKYGNVSNVLGKGAFATVKLCCPVGSKEKYAVKEFRKKKKEESTVRTTFLNAYLEMFLVAYFGIFVSFVEGVYQKIAGRVLYCFFHGP